METLINFSIVATMFCAPTRRLFRCILMEVHHKSVIEFAFTHQSMWHMGSRDQLWKWHVDFGPRRRLNIFIFTTIHENYVLCDSHSVDNCKLQLYFVKIFVIQLLFFFEKLSRKRSFRTQSCSSPLIRFKRRPRFPNSGELKAPFNHLSCFASTVICATSPLFSARWPAAWHAPGNRRLCCQLFQESPPPTTPQTPPPLHFLIITGLVFIWINLITGRSCTDRKSNPRHMYYIWP